jgi:hypothetical protein
MLFIYRADLHGAFLDCGILSTMTEWLAPLPDKSLPNLLIRQAFLKILGEVCILETIIIIECSLFSFIAVGTNSTRDFGFFHVRKPAS